MKSIGIGFVGAGWMGSTQLRQLAKRSDVQIHALLEPNADRGRALLQEIGLSPSLLVQDYEQIITDPRIDAVWLVSPNSFHGPQSLAAMQAGKHVFCEKPAATRYDEFVKQVELDRSRPDLMTFVDYILYFDPFEERLRQMISQGAFGKITQIQVNYRYPVNITGDKVWKLQKEIMGDAIGMAINHAISVIVLAMAGQAKPVAVYATRMPAQVRQFQSEPIWNIMIRFDNGATGVCLGNIDSSNGYDAYHDISGTEGALVYQSLVDRPQKVRYWSHRMTRGKWIYPLDAERCARDGAADLAWPAETTTPDSGDVINHQVHHCIDHFLESIRTGRKSPLSFCNSAAISEIGWAAQKSAACGREISLP